MTHPAMSNMSKLASRCILPVVIGAVMVLAGCATPATHEAMVPASIATVKKHPQTVSLSVNGGQETDAMAKSQISNEALTQALAQAIENSKTFSKVIKGANGDHVLAVNIFSIEQPSFGLSFTVKMEAGWTLKKADTNTVVWQESIKSEHTATPSDAFVAITRLRLATEGAARNNIDAGLKKISSLNL